MRVEQALTLEKAAERGEMDLKHWQKVEAGVLNPTLVTLLRIADGLGVTIASLFTELPAPKTKTRGVKASTASIVVGKRPPMRSE